MLYFTPLGRATSESITGLLESFCRSSRATFDAPREPASAEMRSTIMTARTIPHIRRPLPAVVDRAEWQRRRNDLLVREKSHTRAGDVISAERRRLPMTPVPAVELIGADGPVPLLDAFEGRSLLVA